MAFWFKKKKKVEEVKKEESSGDEGSESEEDFDNIKRNVCVEETVQFVGDGLRILEKVEYEDRYIQNKEYKAGLDQINEANGPYDLIINQLIEKFSKDLQLGEESWQEIEEAAEKQINELILESKKNPKPLQIIEEREPTVYDE